MGNSRAVQRVRSYLGAVYPADALGSASDSEVVRTFRSLQMLYQFGEADVPLDALEPGMFASGQTASTALRCADSDQPFAGILMRDETQRYRDLMPCWSGADLVRRLADYAPDWLATVEARGTDVYFEVQRFAHTTLWYGENAAQPQSWADFLDTHRIHGSGWWFMHAPGSGIFYHAGRTLTAPTKLAMMVKLLAQWLAEDRFAWPSIEAEIKRIAWQARVGPDIFLVKLRKVMHGEFTCEEAGVPSCYDHRTEELNSPAARSWTLYDVPYDDLCIRMGRALGYDTLMYYATEPKPDQRNDLPHELLDGSSAEMVDLRRPAWASWPNSDTSDDWRWASEQDRAQAWVQDMRTRGSLSLRSPLDPAHGPSRPCDFGMTHHLACRGHVSWTFHDATPELRKCAVPGPPSPPPGTIVHWYTRDVPDCFCVDICGADGARLPWEGVNFVGRTRNVWVRSQSPWALYLNAVYNGRAPLPFSLGRLNAFYLHSPAWRSKHPGVPNPFRDCHRQWQQRCPQSECALWKQDWHTRSPSAPQAITSFLWPQTHWSGADANAELRLVQLFSSDDSSFGRELGPPNTWVEIMRSDARPFFEEGLTPPHCPDWSPGEPYRGQQCWERLHEHNGARFPPGCWARPAVGTGVWINTNRTRHAHDLFDSESISKGSATPVEIKPSHRKRYGRTLEYILYARSEGIDTLQFTFGDPWMDVKAPLLIITSETCVGRNKILRTCLDCQTRSGWADLPCVCDDTTRTIFPDGGYLASVEAQTPEQQPPFVAPGSAFPRAGPLNCAVP